MPSALVLHTEPAAASRLAAALSQTPDLDVAVAGDSVRAQLALGRSDLRLVVVPEVFEGRGAASWAAQLRPASTLVLAGRPRVGGPPPQVTGADAVLGAADFLSPRLRGVVANALATAQARHAAGAPRQEARRRVARLSQRQRRTLENLLDEMPVEPKEHRAVLAVLGVGTPDEAAALMDLAAA